MPSENRPSENRRGSIAAWRPSRLSLCLLALFVLLAGLGLSEAEETLRARQARLESMTSAEKDELRRKKERFDALPREERIRLRRLHQDLSQESNAEQLREVMVRYGEWLATLTASQRAELLGMDVKERIATIREILKEQERERFQQLVETRLPAEDLKTIHEWLLRFVADHESELIAILPKETQPQVAAIADPARRAQLLILPLFRRRGGGGPPSRPLVTTAKVPMPTAEDAERLMQRLSPEARRILQAARDPNERLQIVMNWMRAAVFSKWRSMPPVNEAELKRFVAEDLSDRDRDYLESLPRERMRRELLFLYYRQQRIGDWPRRPPYASRSGGRGAPGEGGPPRRGGSGYRDNAPRDGRSPGGGGRGGTRGRGEGPPRRPSE